MYTVWSSTEQFARYIINNTRLAEFAEVEVKTLYESDASKPKQFHQMPDHIKQILYLDAPDIILDFHSEPLFSIEVSTEAGTGHNVFQRFARLAASVENGVPAFYIYPQAGIVKRQVGTIKWDVLNRLIFDALEAVMNIHKIPALLFYYPSDYPECPESAANSQYFNTKGLKMDDEFISCPDSQSPEMGALFGVIDDLLQAVSTDGIHKARENSLALRSVQERKRWMNRQTILGEDTVKDPSPISATQVIPTSALLAFIEEKIGYSISGTLLRSREETILYVVNAKFRGDPYPGALAALDYLLAREGRTFEERKYNLVLCWATPSYNKKTRKLTLPTTAKSSIKDFVDEVKKSEEKNLLGKDYEEVKRDHSIPRYYMQVRYGSMYSKNKHIRVYSYFSDAILFTDGVLWRDA